MNEEVLRLLLEKNLSFLETLTSSCMLWWVSSVIFCGSLLAGIWTKQDDIREMPFFNWLFFVAFVFIASIVCFGFWVIEVSYRLESQAGNLLMLVNSKAEIPAGFGTLRHGMLLGTSSFVFVLITLLGMWRVIGKSRKKKRQNS